MSLCFTGCGGCSAAWQDNSASATVCGDYRAINDICLLHQAPVKDAREVTAQFKAS